MGRTLPYAVNDWINEDDFSSARLTTTARSASHAITAPLGIPDMKGSIGQFLYVQSLLSAYIWFVNLYCNFGAISPCRTAYFARISVLSIT